MRRITSQASAGLAMVLMLAACGSNLEIAIDTAYGEPSSDTVEVGLAEGCNEEIDVTVDESDAEVTVTATRANDPEPDGEDCGESRTIELGAPLGDRDVIDGSSGDSVELVAPES